MNIVYHTASFSSMGQELRIAGGKPLSGTIVVAGAKNAAAPIIAASMLTSGKVVLHNVPNIVDIRRFLELFQNLGARIRFVDEHTVEIVNDGLDAGRLDTHLVGKMRMSNYIMSAVTPRCGELTVPLPGGDQIGSRPMDSHFLAFEAMGMKTEKQGEFYHLDASHLHGGEVVMSEMSVTGTANALILASQIEEPIVIYNAAAEHYLQDLCWFLQAIGVQIDGIGTHTLRVRGTRSFHGAEYTIMPDPIETGTFLALAAATQSEVTVAEIAPEFLRLEFQKFHEANAHFIIGNTRTNVAGKYLLADCRVRPSRLRAVKKVNTMPYPGFTSDLLPPFSVMLTQAEGTSLIHEWMYEGRQKYIAELQKMGANITICDPHRALIVGPTPLRGVEMTSFDIRAGVTLIIAALTATGESRILNIEQIDRGYEHIEERLRVLGADIQRQTS